MVDAIWVDAIEHPYFLYGIKYTYILEISWVGFIGGGK